MTSVIKQFFPRRRRTQMTVTFTQTVDFERLAEGTISTPGGWMDISMTCSCGGRMSSNAPFVVTKPNSVTWPYACLSCRTKTDVVFTVDVENAAVAR